MPLKSQLGRYAAPKLSFAMTIDSEIGAVRDAKSVFEGVMCDDTIDQPELKSIDCELNSSHSTFVI